MNNTTKTDLTTAEQLRLEYHCSLPINRIESILSIAHEFAVRQYKDTALLLNELHLHIMRKDMAQKELDALRADVQNHNELFRFAHRHIVLLNRAIELVRENGIRTEDNQYPVTL